MLNKIKVGGLVYDVVPTKWERKDNGELQFGLYNVSDTNILINESISEQVQNQTLIHEMTHAIFYEAGIELDNEEDLVTRISGVLYQILQDNDLSFIRNAEEGVKYSSEGKLTNFNDDITINADALKGIANNVNVDSKVKITEDGIKTSSANKESQPYPVQRALKRIKEIDYITDVRIDEEFETTVDDFPENRLTITIDYLDVDIVKKMKKADKYKLD